VSSEWESRDGEALERVVVSWCLILAQPHGLHLFPSLPACRPALWASRASVHVPLTAVDADAPSLLSVLPEPLLLLSTGTPAFALLWPGGVMLLPSANQIGSKDNAVKFLVLEGWGEAK